MNGVQKFITIMNMFLFIGIVYSNNDIKLIEKKLHDKDPKTREINMGKFVEVLDRKTALQNIDLITHLLKDDDIQVRKATSHSIGELFIKKRKDTVFYEDDPIDRLEMNADYLKAAEKVIPLLIISLKDPDKKVREYAARSLGMIGKPAKIANTELIKQYDRENDSVVKLSIQRALLRINE